MIRMKRMISGLWSLLLCRSARTAMGERSHVLAGLPARGQGGEGHSHRALASATFRRGAPRGPIRRQISPLQGWLPNFAGRAPFADLFCVCQTLQQVCDLACNERTATRKGPWCAQQRMCGFDGGVGLFSTI